MFTVSNNALYYYGSLIGYAYTGRDGSGYSIVYKHNIYLKCYISPANQQGLREESIFFGWWDLENIKREYAAKVNDAKRAMVMLYDAVTGSVDLNTLREFPLITLRTVIEDRCNYALSQTYFVVHDDNKMIAPECVFLYDEATPRVTVNGRTVNISGSLADAVAGCLWKSTYSCRYIKQMIARQFIFHMCEMI